MATGVAVVVAVVAFRGGSPTLPGGPLEHQLGAGLTVRVGVPVVVTCPERSPRRTGVVVRCWASRSDTGAASVIVVTLTASDGSYAFTAEDPAALLGHRAPV